MSRKQPTIPPDEDPQIQANRIERRERSLDDALEGSFPASDPPAAIAPHRSHN